MKSHPSSAVPLIHHPVIVRPEPPGQFTAEPLGVPELRVVAASVEEALAQVRLALASWQGSFHWIAVPVAAPASSPVEQWAGHAKDDPDFDAYLDEIRRYRQEVDERECPTSSSTPII